MKEKTKDSTPRGSGIAVSYGGCYMGYTYGSGYGKEATVTRHADKIAARIHKRFGLNVVKRGNYDGKSCGAHHDGHYAFGCSAAIRGGNRILFSAYYETEDKECLDKKYLEDNPDTSIAFRSGFDGGHIFVCSVGFSTATEAIRWLTKEGKKHCPPIKENAHGKKP